MTASVGEVVYRLGKVPCSGLGLRWSDDELNAALQGQVADVVLDDKGKAHIAELLTAQAETEFVQEHEQGFPQDRLRRVLEGQGTVEDWQVGEAIAVTYLTDHRSCIFPWPAGRDLKRSGSSLPGADLVGFGVDLHGNCFTFGEVKTSREHRYPPRVTYGRTGLRHQLEDLRDHVGTRDNLVAYLGHRARIASWSEQYRQATRRYLQNPSDVQIYGVLVRDVEPQGRDLQALVGSLNTERPEAMHIELLALYLPLGSLEGIGETVLSISRRSGAEQ